MTTSFKHLAVAAVAAASFASAQAATFEDKALSFFTVDSQLTSALSSFGSVVLDATGGAQYSNGLLSFVADTATFTSAADLVLASSAGLSLTAEGTTIKMSGLGYNNATGMLTGTMSADGANVFTGNLLEIYGTPKSTTTFSFDSVVGSGSLLTGTFHMTNGAAKALGRALGGALGAAYAPTIQGYSFGTMTVAVPEPSTYALMGLGLVGVALAARKRKAA
jgi:PEP-CTERM motif